MALCRNIRGDTITDQSGGPFEEFMKVNSGDGKSSIGGKGLHVFNTQTPLEDRQTLSVDWNIELN